MGLGALQPMHLIVVLVIVLLVFGPGKLPELGKAVGDGLRELKKATSGDDKEKADAAHAATATSTVTPIGATPPDLRARRAMSWSSPSRVDHASASGSRTPPLELPSSLSPPPHVVTALLLPPGRVSSTLRALRGTSTLTA